MHFGHNPSLINTDGSTFKKYQADKSGKSSTKFFKILTLFNCIKIVNSKRVKSFKNKL